MSNEIHPEQEEVLVNFDPHDDKDLQEIINILSKKGKNRKNSELQSLFYILKDIPFFAKFWKQYPPEIHEAILKELQYEFVPKGKPVFFYGDVGKQFYIILRGSVYILLPDKNHRAEIEKFTSAIGNKSANKISTISSLPRSHENISREGSAANTPMASSKGEVDDFTVFHEAQLELEPILSEEMILHLYPNNTILNTLFEKNYFGEIALELHTLRTASVVAREDTYFLTLGSGPYRKILKEYRDQVQTATLKLLSSNPLTNGWPLENLNGLMRQLKEVRFLRNQVIYDIGDPSEYIYFIREGEIELTKEMDKKADEIEFGNKMSKEREIMAGSIDMSNSLLNMNTVWRKKYKKLMTDYIRCAILGANQTFGEEEIINKQPRRHFRAVVKSSSVDLLMIPTKKFLDNAPNPAQFYKKLKEKDLKQKWRESLTSDIIQANQVTEKQKQLYSANKLSFKTNTSSLIPIASMEGFKKKEVIKYRSPSYSNLSLKETFTPDITLDPTPTKRVLYLPSNISLTTSPKNKTSDSTLLSAVDTPQARNSSTAALPITKQPMASQELKLRKNKYTGGRTSSTRVGSVVSDPKRFDSQSYLNNLKNKVLSQPDPIEDPRKNHDNYVYNFYQGEKTPKIDLNRIEKQIRLSNNSPEMTISSPKHEILARQTSKLWKTTRDAHSKSPRNFLKRTPTKTTAVSSPMNSPKSAYHSRKHSMPLTTKATTKSIEFYEDPIQESLYKALRINHLFKPSQNPRILPKSGSLTNLLNHQEISTDGAKSPKGISPMIYMPQRSYSTFNLLSNNSVKDLNLADLETNPAKYAVSLTGIKYNLTPTTNECKKRIGLANNK